MVDSLQSPMDFSKKIAEALNVKLSVVEEYFDVDEDKQGFFYAKLKAKKFLDKFQFRILCDLARKYGGEGYVEGAKAWRVPSSLAKVPQDSSTQKSIPLSTQPSIPTSTPKASPTEVLDEDTETLRGSAKKVGFLYPVLTDSFGNVIDGFHRLKADPNWPKFKLDHVSDPVQLTIARLIANTRRDVPAEEKKEGLTQLIKMTGWTPKQLSESLGWSLRTVYDYLPSEFKDQTKAEAGALGGLKSAASLAPKSQDSRQEVANLKPQDMSEGQIREFLDNPKVKEIVVAMNPSEFIPNADESTGESIPKPRDNSEPAHAHPNRLEGIQVHEFHCSECDQTFFIDHISPKIHKLHAVREVS